MEFLKQISKHKYISELFILLGIVGVISPVILPYIHSGFFPTHDGEWAVVRLVDMYRSIKDIQFPVRYSGSLNFGYGYPLFNFAYPMPYYLGLIFVFLKFGFVGSIKMLFVASIIFGAIGMYFLSRDFFRSKPAGIVSAVFYTYMPYHLVDLFVRGSIGESVAFGVFPYILLFTHNMFVRKQKLLFAILAGSFLGFLIPTHNIMAVLFLPVFLLFILSLYLSKRIPIWNILVIFLVGFGLSSFFFIPALLEKHNILLSVIPIADRSLYFVTPFQLLFSPFGYGTPTEINPFTYQIGIPLVISFFIVCFLLAKNIHVKNEKYINTVLIFLGILDLFFVFLLFSQSSFIWENTPFLSEINYPWTLLSQIGLILSFFVGYLFTQGKLYSYVAILLGCLTIILCISYAKPYEYIDRGEIFYTTNLATTTSSNELMPLWVKSQPTTQVGEKVAIEKGKGSISELYNSSDEIHFKANLDSSATVVVNTIYYPGWIAQKGNISIPITYDNPKGVMELVLDRGESYVTLRFAQTPIRLFSNMISLITFIFVILFLLFKVFKRVRKRNG